MFDCSLVLFWLQKRKKHKRPRSSGSPEGEEPREDERKKHGHKKKHKKHSKKSKKHSKKKHKVSIGRMQ